MTEVVAEARIVEEGLFGLHTENDYSLVSLQITSGASSYTG